MKFRFIDDVNKLHKMWSVKAAAAAGTIQATWLSIPDFAKAHLPSGAETVVGYIVVFLIVLVPFLRSLDQTPKDSQPQKDDTQ